MGDLERAVREFAEAKRRADAGAPGGEEAFRAAIERRLAQVEAQLSQVENRVTGLLFVLLGAVATNLIVGVAT